MTPVNQESAALLDYAIKFAGIVIRELATRRLRENGVRFKKYWGKIRYQRRYERRGRELAARKKRGLK